jgi:phosphatidylserine/phosphatidylglycerophosphate/cardiolipin synthase-like enzyme
MRRRNMGSTMTDPSRADGQSRAPVPGGVAKVAATSVDTRTPSSDDAVADERSREMFRAGTAVGSITPYFLTQANVHLDPNLDLADQPRLSAIEAQAAHAAAVVAGFVDAATATVDIAIYDFRLLPGAPTDVVVNAINGAADRGVAVRIAYDKSEAASEGSTSTVKVFRAAGADPAPGGTEHFLEQSMHASVKKRAIDPGSQIMHNKYILRDRDEPSAAVLTGSANFTTDAWGIQDNNIVVITDAPALAQAYGADFDSLWNSRKVAGSASGDKGTATVGAQQFGFAFAPGEGANAGQELATAISGAQHRLLIASMVLTATEVLDAIAGQLDLVRGAFDGSEMAQTEAEWRRGAVGSTSAKKLATWQAIEAHLVRKPSIAFDEGHPNRPHNFMHNKLIVADDLVVTGSFNFSANAEKNAENLLWVSDADLADQYATCVEGLITRYSR